MLSDNSRRTYPSQTFIIFALVSRASGKGTLNAYITRAHRPCRLFSPGAYVSSSAMRITYTERIYGFVVCKGLIVTKILALVSRSHSHHHRLSAFHKVQIEAIKKLKNIKGKKIHEFDYNVIFEIEKIFEFQLRL